MKQLVIKLVVFSVLFIALLHGVFDTHFYGKTRFSQTLNDFKSYDSGGVDILFCGSSRVFTSFNPRMIDLVFNTTSFNLATSAQNLESTAFLVEDIFKNSSPKLIVLDVSPGDMYHLHGPDVQKYQLEVFDNVSFSIGKYRHLLSDKEFTELPRLVSSTIRNHEDWDNKLFGKENYYETNEATFVRGYANDPSSFGNNNADYGNYKEEYKDFNTHVVKLIPGLKKLPKNAEDALRRIYKTIKDNDAQLILVTVPYLPWYKDKNFDYVDYTSSIQTLADELDVNYLDFNQHYDELKLTFEDFKDTAHLNSLGAHKLNLYFINYLKSVTYNGKDTEVGYKEKNLYNYAFLKNTENYKAELKEIKLIDFQKFREIRFDQFIVFDVNKNKRNIALRFALDEALDPTTFSIKIDYRPTSKYSKFLNSRVLEEGGYRDIFSSKPIVLKDVDYNYLIVETPYSAIEAYKFILLFFQNSESSEIEGEPMVIDNVVLD